MAEYIIRGETEDVIFHYSRHKALKKFLDVRRDIGGKYSLFLVPAFFISPILFYVSLFVLLELYWSELIYEFFYDRRKFNKYNKIMQPKSAGEVLTVVGYRIFSEELEEHLGLVSDRTESGAEKLRKKQQFMELEENKYREVGFDDKILKTHLLLPGKTGSGKTEGIRSIADDVLKIGGGFLFNDGKSDEKMLREFQNQAKRAGRETSCYVLNFLKPEVMGESNTFSPLGIMHPVKIVEFFGSLIGGGGGEGNGKYFFNRGKAMLFPVVNATAIRDKTFKEGFSLEKIFDNTSVVNISLLYVATYCMAREINENIKRSPRLSVALSASTTVVPDQNFKEVERVIEFITQNPTKIDMVEEAGITFVQIKEIYSNSYSLLRGYLEKVWNQFGPLLLNVSDVIYIMCKIEGFSFLGADGARIDDIKKKYNQIKEMVATKQDAAAMEFQKMYGLSTLQMRGLVEAFQGGNKGSVDNPPPDAIQQHAYAQQQFDQLSGIFTMYKHIFGQNRPEIRPDKLIKDNKFLYILLPVLEIQPDQVEILGKMIVMTIREVAAIALGGEKLSIHKTLANIAKDKVTPKPFSFVVLDEYGAYPVEGIDTILAQVRSLNMSVAIAVQDYASLKAGGSDETSQQRSLANTTKLILKVEDDKAIEWVDRMLTDHKYETNKWQKSANGNMIAGQDVEIEKRKAFDPRQLRDFDNGFSVLLIGSDADGVVFLQSFYRGGVSENIFVKRYNPFDI